MDRNLNQRMDYLQISRKLDQILIELQRLADPAKRMANEWLDTNEVMLVLSISRRTLSHLTRTNQLKHVRVGHKNYFKLADVQEFLEHGGPKSGNAAPLSPKQREDRQAP